MNARKSFKWVFFLFVLFFLNACENGDPCSRFYWTDNWEGSMGGLEITDCPSANWVYSNQEWSYGHLDYIEFTVYCDNGDSFSGSISYTYDGLGKRISRSLTVDGKFCGSDTR